MEHKHDVTQNKNGKYFEEKDRDTAQAYDKIFIPSNISVTI